MKLVLRQLTYPCSGSDADKLKFPLAIPKIKATGLFHIVEDKHTLVAGFKA
jgi:hypothetical protein